MKKLLSILFVFITLNSFSQQFDGVPISGTLPNIIAKFKAKGYVFESTDKTVTTMKGRVANYPIELLIVVTPKTKQVCKVVIYFDKETNWYSLKNQYLKFKDVLIEKYGEYSSNYEFFRKPYFEGDGYEMSAVGLDNVVYSTYWLNTEMMNIVVEIEKYKQVSISYENVELMRVKKNENMEIENNSF
jgi:hypothetical protein